MPKKKVICNPKSWSIDPKAELNSVFESPQSFRVFRLDTSWPIALHCAGNLTTMDEVNKFIKNYKELRPEAKLSVVACKLLEKIVYTDDQPTTDQ